MLTLTLMLTFVSSSLFILSAHPLVLGGLIFGQGLIYVAMLFYSTLTSWLSYILLMVYLGALMILFMYVSSISPNQINTGNAGMAARTILFCILLSMSASLLTYQLSSLSSFSMVSSSGLLLREMYGPILSPVTLIMVLYLLIILIGVVWFVRSAQAPLRVR
uniref:NADH dehydrogenase subunit 6 n=1 Tax=Stygobromus foliatus TaxID=1678291 RepID=A0A172QHF4_9CRUS|nr:NADH dehydrogenase subunit 6 [Stygobromus foliatus]